MKVRLSLDSERLTFRGTLTQIVVSFIFIGALFTNGYFRIVDIFVLKLQLHIFVPQICYTEINDLYGLILNL